MMFNTSFSNKIKIKIKNIFLFILLGRTRVNELLVWTRPDPGGTVEQWSMDAPLLMGFLHTKSNN